LYHIKNALDEECFKVLDLENYENIKQQLAEIKDSKVAFVDNVKREIDHLLE
jgi:(p)ppGpp synthase/HD superfamily hydrolase|tara:strand:+ start:208 stop:363 length:156 start_codon:yes stop_codon:yes gene_type:complete